MPPAASRPTAVLYCQVRYGAGHWVRAAALAEALTPAFRVVLATSGDVSTDLHRSDDVECVSMPVPSDDFLGRPPSSEPGLGAALTALLERSRASVFLTESFPFGRQNLVLEMSRCLTRLRSQPGGPLVVSSVRDIEQRAQPGQEWLDRLACDTANRYFDAVLVHTDARVASFGDTFPLASKLTIPVHETGYISREHQRAEPTPRNAVVVVSAGGGRGGDALLLTAADAQRHTDLSRDFAMRMFAGTYASDSTWSRLQEAARTAPRLEVRRWSPDLRGELTRASVSVSRCGYNTAIDVIASRVASVMVPFATPTEDEQTRRAGRLAHLGLVRTVADEGLTPETLVEEIRQTARWSPASIVLDTNGGPRTAELLRAWVRP